MPVEYFKKRGNFLKSNAYKEHKQTKRKESKMNEIMKIQVKEVNYFGYKQGVKVLIDGVKYPKKRGYVYSEYKDNQNAINQAIKEHASRIF
tara:strand:- start:178 stop:450 length:273 start_codon:yes stop_codon:yes gene_type:complete